MRLFVCDRCKKQSELFSDNSSYIVNYEYPYKLEFTYTGVSTRPLEKIGEFCKECKQEIIRFALNENKETNEVKKNE